MIVLKPRVIWKLQSIGRKERLLLFDLVLFGFPFPGCSKGRPGVVVFEFKTALDTDGKGGFLHYNVKF